MRPGNKSLFWSKISPKSHFICPQSWPCQSKVLWNAWLKCMTFIWDLQSVFQMVHNLHKPRNDFQWKNADKRWRNCNNFSKDLHLRSYLTFEMAWRSSLLCQDEWWPACTEHDIILMPPGAHWLECMEVQVTCADLWWWLTYLLDLLGFPQLHR